MHSIALKGAKPFTARPRSAPSGANVRPVGTSPNRKARRRAHSCVAKEHAAATSTAAATAVLRPVDEELPGAVKSMPVLRSVPGGPLWSALYGTASSKLHVQLGTQLKAALVESYEVRALISRTQHRQRRDSTWKALWKLCCVLTLCIHAMQQLRFCIHSMCWSMLRRQPHIEGVMRTACDSLLVDTPN